MKERREGLARRAIGAAARPIAVLGLLASSPAALWAQEPPASTPAPLTFKSLGQPPLIKPYVAGSLTWTREGEGSLGGAFVAGLYKDLFMPIAGAFGVSAEGYVGGIGSTGSERGGWDGGARFFATSRLLFLNAGIDWNARLEKADFILAFTPYFRRGGLFGTGGNFRFEWIPGRGNSFNFGFQVPLEPHMGKTRPVHRDARPPKAPSPARPAPDAHGGRPGPGPRAPRFRPLAHPPRELLQRRRRRELLQGHGEVPGRRGGCEEALPGEGRPPPRRALVRPGVAALRRSVRRRLRERGRAREGPRGGGPGERGPARRGPAAVRPAHRALQEARHPRRVRGRGPPRVRPGPRGDGRPRPLAEEPPRSPCSTRSRGCSSGPGGPEEELRGRRAQGLDTARPRAPARAAGLPGGHRRDRRAGPRAPLHPGATPSSPRTARASSSSSGAPSTRPATTTCSGSTTTRAASAASPTRWPTP